MSTVNTKTDALAVAEYFILKAREQKCYVTNKKLQKLVYYAQAWSLALNNRKMFDEKIEAWVHGPAIREVYSEYKKHGFSSFTKRVNISLIETISDKNKLVLDSVWAVYGKFDGDYLEMLTHSEMPWQKAREGLSSTDNSDNEISTIIMKTYYSDKLRTIS
ncbi:MAG: hypothetical protein RI996_215 [Candidatus Parcubacteria bacterium]|jgi:uncharacterized phage-associated protein